MWAGLLAVSLGYTSALSSALLTDWSVLTLGMSDVAVKYLSTSEAERSSLPRILQMSSEEQYTKYEMCQLFAEILGIPLDNMEANTEGNDPNASVQRPYDCHLSTKALKDLGIDVSTQDFVGWWRRELRAFRH